MLLGLNVQASHCSAGTDVWTHGSHGVGARHFRLRSRWPHYKPSSDRYSVRSHTGTDQEHMEDSLCGGMMIYPVSHLSTTDTNITVVFTPEIPQAVFDTPV